MEALGFSRARKVRQRRAMTFLRNPSQAHSLGIPAGFVRHSPLMTRSQAILEAIRCELTRRAQELERDGTVRVITFRIAFDENGKPHKLEFEKRCRRFVV